MEVELPAQYTLKKLPDIDDSAVRFGIAEVQEARFANQALECEDTGFSYHRVKPGRRQAFAHKHDRAEEVYVVLAGAGRVKLDDEVVGIQKLDAIRVAPGVIRQFEAGPDGMEMLAFGARHEGDGEIIQDWWTE
jgi:mannose-6-phosphate isomerase-like protein (cupin superfamily)